jgi:hypothetical protein
MKGKSFLFVLCSALLVALLLSSCGSDPNANTDTGINGIDDTIASQVATQPATPTETSTSGGNNTEGQANVPTKVGNMEVTVTDGKIVSKVGVEKPQPGNIFVVLNVTVKNIGTAKENVNRYLNYSIKDANGKGGQSLIFIDWAAGDLAPGESKTGEAGFEVADGPVGTHYYFTFTSNKQSVTWTVEKVS